MLTFAPEDYLRIERVFREKEESLRRLAYRYLGDDQLAQDVVQDAIEAFWKNYAKVSYMTDDQLGGYLYGMTKNKIYSAYRKAAREVPIEEIEDMPHSQTVEDIVISKIDVEVIERHIGELPARYGMYITMAYLDELEPETIAKVLGVKPNSLRMIACRARKLLAELCLQDKEAEE